jgi:hypothetical protein
VPKVFDTRMENTGPLTGSIPVITEIPAPEYLVEKNQPEFYALCKSVISLYNEIPDQRFDLLSFQAKRDAVELEKEKLRTLREEELRMKKLELEKLEGDPWKLTNEIWILEDELKKMSPRAQPLEKWHCWKALHDEFMTLENSIFVGNMFDTEMYSFLIGKVDETVTSYVNLIDKFIFPAKLPDVRGSKKKKAKEVLRCHQCGERGFVIDEGEGMCQCCDASFDDQMIDDKGNVIDLDSDDDSEEDPGLDIRFCSPIQIEYIKNWNISHPEDPILLRGANSTSSLREEQKKSPPQKLEKQKVGDLIGPFCATYPTISYVLIKAGLHYPLAIKGDHPILVREVLSLRPSLSSEKETPKKKATTKKSPPKAKAKGKVDKTKSKGKVVEVKERVIHNVSLPKLKEQFECYAHQWVNYSTSANGSTTNSSTICVLLSQTQFVPRILIEKARKTTNIELLKVLCKMDYDAHRSYMHRSIIILKVPELMYLVETGDNLDLAITCCNTPLLRKILVKPGVIEAAKKEKKNIMGLMVRGIRKSKTSDSMALDLIKTIGEYFTMERFCPPLAPTDQDSQESEEDEPSEEEEVEDDDGYGSNQIDVLNVVISCCDLSCILALMRYKTMDIASLLSTKYDNNHVSPLVKILSILSLDDDEKDFCDTMNELMGLYIFDKQNLLQEAARIGYHEVIKFLTTRHEYSVENLVDAMISSKPPRDNVHLVLMNKIKSLRPRESILEPVIFQRK